MATSYIWLGVTGTLVGRFGPLTKGDVVSLTDEEVTAVAGNTLWAVLPVNSDKKFLPLATATTLTVAQTGLVILSSHTAPVTYTLPAAPTGGIGYDFQFAPGAVGDITLGRNGKTIDGLSADFVIAIATVCRCGVYYNGTGWISYS